jgi:8-hydroxy-5-deazaflavin:NADPH oxidoreductase
VAWRDRKHDVAFGVRNPDDPKCSSLAAVQSNESAAAAADVVALRTPWQGTKEAINGCGELAGQVVIDCTNPLTADFSALEVGLTTSGMGTNSGFGLLRGQS